MYLKTLVKSILLLSIIILPFGGFGQTIDSLTLLMQDFEVAIEESRMEDADRIVFPMYKEASKSLDAAAYDLFYRTIANPSVQKSPGLLGKTYHYLGNLEFFRGRMGAAENSFSNALTYYQQAGRTNDAAGMAMNLGIIQERRGSYDSAILSYETAIPIFTQLGDTAAIAICTENIALAYDYKGNAKQALHYINMTDSILKLCTPAKNIRWTNFYYNQSSILSSVGDFEKSVASAFRGLRLSEELGNDSQTNMGYIMLMHAYNSFGDEENWLKYAREARSFARKSQNELRLTELNESMAYHHLDRGDLDSANYYARLVDEFYTSDNISEGKSKSILLQGNIAYKLGNYQLAIAEFEKAVGNLTESGSRESARAYHNLGMSYIMIKDYNQAKNYLLKGLELRTEMDDIKGMSSSLRGLADASEGSGDYKQAIEYFRRHKALEDSVFNENKLKQIATLEAQYESEKKDQEIAGLQQEAVIQNLLADKRQTQIYLALGGLILFSLVAFFFYYRSRLKQRANSELVKKNSQIEKQSKEKELLLKEIHHRVKNNLQIISSLLNMQSRGESDLKVKDAMKESQSRVKTMALIHEKLYQYDNLSRISMEEYMNQLSSFLSQTYRSDKDIKIEIDTDDIDLDIDYAVPLGLITNELLSNALKYAFQDNDQGLIIIRLKKQTNEKLILTISDTGKGLDKEIDMNKTNSLGLKLVKTLTRQIHGELNVTNSPGATFSINFSISDKAA